MRNNGLNFAAFVLLAGCLLGGWYYAEKTFFPKPPAPPPEPEKLTTPRELAAAVAGGLPLGTPPFAALPPLPAAKPPEPKPALKPLEVKPAAPAAPTPAGEPLTLVALGDDSFFLKVLLVNRGGGVQQVLLTQFDDANRLGLENKDANGNRRPLQLIPGYVRPIYRMLKDEPPHVELTPNLTEAAFKAKAKPGPVANEASLTRPSYSLYHYAAKDDPARAKDDFGRIRSDDDNFPLATLGDRTWKVVDVKQPAGEAWTVAFETDVDAPYFVRVRKTFSLHPKEYDFKLKVDVEALPGRKEKAGLFRYQIAGPVGLPIEGEWYTSTYRNAFIGRMDPNGSVRRETDDAGTIQANAGGDAWPKANHTFLYAAVGTQFFASALAVDGDDPLDYVRATREQTPADPVELLGQPYEREKAFLYDISFRAVTPNIDAAPGKPVSHQYAVYNGPMKVRLLRQLAGDRAVAPEVIDRYVGKYHLDTLTDYHTPTWIGRIANAIWWTDIIIATTNFMHGLLGWLHAQVGDWGVSIILLTVIVKICLILPSRRQQMIAAEMQAKVAVIKPDLEKLQEKYKDDFMKMQQARAELYREAGINQFGQLGGCLLLFAQMPIMMGLYFCLQESVFFRLQDFLWMPNLAAPDMLAWWGELLPVLSSPGNRFGGTSFLYVGPFLNILPFAAVALFYVQQKLTMPPPTNEMEEQQRKMMKYMLVVSALIFYKFAAGLSLYFIVGGLWTILERKLIPKPKPRDPAAPVGDAAADPAAPKSRTAGLLARLAARVEEMQNTSETGRQIRNADEPPPPQPRTGSAAQPPKRDKKKKKRK